MTTSRKSGLTIWVFALSVFAALAWVGARAEEREPMPREQVLSEIVGGAQVAVLKPISLERSISKDFRMIQFQAGRELPKGEAPKKTADSAQVFGTMPKTLEIPTGTDYQVCAVDEMSNYIGFDIRKFSCDPKKAKKGSFWVYFAYGTDAEAHERTLGDLFNVLGFEIEFR